MPKGEELGLREMFREFLVSMKCFGMRKNGRFGPWYSCGGIFELVMV